MWTHYQPPVSPHSLDLDEMFGFLQEERADLKQEQKVEALKAINEQFEQLDTLCTQTEEVCAILILVFQTSLPSPPPS